MLNLSNALEAIPNRIPKLLLSEKKIMTAFFMSKMTVPNENEDGPIVYWNLKFVEFLEFIGRLAWLKYQDTSNHKSWTMVQKVENIIDGLLAYINGQRIDPSVMNQVESDSDDDYCNNY